MGNPDTFEFELRLSHWLFTLAIGLPLGIVLAGLWGLRPHHGERKLWLAVALFGAIAGVLAVLLVWDVSPIARLFFRLKPYLTAAVPAAALMVALGLGAALSFGSILIAPRLAGHRAAPLGAMGLSALAMGAVLLWVEAAETRDWIRHPVGFERDVAEATRVIDGLGIPTGIAVAPNGDIAVVELQSAGFGLFVPDGEGFSERIRTRMPVDESFQGFHVTFHPDYPAQPYVYATAEEQGEGERRMQVFRGRIEGTGVEWQAVITGLPTGQVEAGADHFGSAVTFCDGYLFVTTADTEVNANLQQPLYAPEVVRDEAQSLSSLRGKVLRWRLDGIDLVEAPAIDTGLPIFAYGFRNPFGAGCMHSAGLPVVADNGPLGYDQVRVVTPASNHEWPLSAERDALARPLFDTRGVHIAPTGIAERDTANGSELLISAFAAAAVYALPISEAGEAGRLRLLAEVEGGAFAVAADPAGCAYFSDSRSVWRLEDERCDR